MESRIFGKTNFKAKILTIGGCGPGFESQEKADEAMELAFKKHKLNLLDIAPTYGNAEIRLQPWIEQYRKSFFIAEKTEKRTKKEAALELKQSLEKTGADYFDLYQFHAVGSIEELEIILGPGGAMEVFEEALDTGTIKNIGITGHENIEVFTEALERYDFATVLAPVNVSAMVDPHPHNDFRPLLKKAIEKNVGIQAIKSVLRRRWPTEEKTYNTWYEPLDQQEAIDEAVWFTLSQEGVSSCPLPCDVRLWDMVLDAGERYRKLSIEEQNNIIQKARKRLQRPLFPVS